MHGGTSLEIAGFNPNQKTNKNRKNPNRKSIEKAKNPKQAGIFIMY